VVPEDGQNTTMGSFAAPEYRWRYREPVIVGDGTSLVRGPDDGHLLGLGFTQVRLVLTGKDTGGAFAVSQQPLQPRTLAGPLHRHTHEDGFIYVMRGRIGAQLDERVVYADEGATIMVPKGLRHTFWNPTDTPSEVLELFTPAGLEGWFIELAEIVASGSFDIADIVESGRRFGTEFDLDSLEPLLSAHALLLPGL
jgi:quercetin dioxygenase-like cupin family protein